MSTVVATWIGGDPQPTLYRQCECPYCGRMVKYHYERLDNGSLKPVVDEPPCEHFIDIDPDADHVGFGPDSDLRSKTSEVRIILRDVYKRIAGKGDALSENMLQEAIKLLGG